MGCFFVNAPDAAARGGGLTAYDAAYLELAQRRQLPLATLDDAICVACQCTPRP
jgi:predicted nucleic acid-binding protein